MKITITMELAPEYADPEHPMGLTEEGFELLGDLLSQLGSEIDVSLAP